MGHKPKYQTSKPASVKPALTDIDSISPYSQAININPQLAPSYHQVSETKLTKVCSDSWNTCSLKVSVYLRMKERNK